MNLLPLIEAKRDGAALKPEDWTAAVREFTDGRIPDYQMAAFLMAVLFRGLDPQETRALTLAMRDSGTVLRWPLDPRPVVDKHSTGGVGDKVSLPLVPLLACLGFRVPMISGRSLGITGGTLDKLESIPGFTTALTSEQLLHQVQSLGCAMAGQTQSMVPADRALYALRDVTGTVPSIPLITASILSKKLAEDLTALVLDVKWGRAAFMRTLPEARALADSMIRLGQDCGLRIRALLTEMNTPLGRASGNWLEVKEAVACLRGEGPPDLRQLVLECAAHLLQVSGQASDLSTARTRATTCLDSGQPHAKWEAMLVAQGTELNAYHALLAREISAPCTHDVISDRDGYLVRCDARVLGEVIRDLGGGRSTKDSRLEPAVGLDSMAKPGEPVRAGSPLCRIHAVSPADLQAVLPRVREAFQIEDESPRLDPLLTEVRE